MKALKIVTSLLIILAMIFLGYNWLYPREEWTNRKQCPDCQQLEKQKQTIRVGTVALLEHGKATFTELKTAKKYNLIACDQYCNTDNRLSFNKIGVIDQSTQELLILAIEGVANEDDLEFQYSSFILESYQSVLAKFISLEGGNKIQKSKFKVIDPLASNLNSNDTIFLAYYNYHNHDTDIDTVHLTFFKDLSTKEDNNQYICPDYNGKKAVQPIKSDKKLKPNYVNPSNSKDTLIKLNENLSLYYASFDKNVNLWYNLYIIHKNKRTKLVVGNNYFGVGSELWYDLSPNTKYIVLDGISKDYLYHTDQDSILHERYGCQILDLTSMKTIQTLQGECGGEWNNKNQWVYDEKVIFNGSK